MALIIGMDEAGYGPNLGPLVVGVTVWETRDDPKQVDFWNTFAGAVCGPGEAADGRIVVGDSKALYSPTTGLARLERSVHALFSLLGWQHASFHGLWDEVTGAPADLERAAIPWYADGDLSLPLAMEPGAHAVAAANWQELVTISGLRPLAARCAIVLPQRFNELTAQYDSKGQALTRISLELLRSVWDPHGDAPAFVIADKHGGRNRYDGLLNEVLEGPMAFRLDEGRERSRYKVGAAEIRFQTRAEEHFPVALASMTAKYVRELAMEQFNSFWQRHLPGLKPTKGYPVDAARFREEIADTQREMGIVDEVLWRVR